MTQILAPRPFSTLGVKPFLFIEESDREILQREYFRLSRKLHPDMSQDLSEDERALLESASAQLNQDYSRLKDFWKLLESVIHGVRVPLREGKKSGLTHPAIATEYFDLQESLLEDGHTSPAFQKKSLEFVSKLSSSLRDTEARARAFAKRFLFQGPGDAAAPWTDKDLETLAEILNEDRYLKSLERDFNDKLKNRMTA